MGCKNSKPAPYQLCKRAYEGKEQIDINQLRNALTMMADRSEVNASSDIGLTALDYAVLNQQPQGEVVELLIEAGADVFAGCSARSKFHSTPIGRALKYEAVN